MANLTTTDFVQAGPLSEALNGAPVVITQTPAGTWNIQADGTSLANLKTALALVSPEANGTFTSTVTVPAGQGLDTAAAGALAIGATTATSVVVTPNTTVSGTLAVTGTTALTGKATATGGVAGLQNSSKVTSTTVNATKAQLASITVVPTVTLAIGSVVEAIVEGTCTSSNADSAVFLLTAGTVGDTTDATVASFTVTTAGSGSAVPFSVKVTFVCRTLGASGTGAGSLVCINNGTTGIAAAAITVVAATSSTWATTTATKIGINATTAATSALTVQNATLKVLS